MSAKGLLLGSLVKLLELVLPKQAAAAETPFSERSLDPPMQLAVRVVQTWADVNHIPLPRAFIIFSAENCPPSHQIRSEIHWAIKSLFTRVRDDHAALLEEQYRFKLELAVATASRAWYLIEERDEDDEIDATHVVGEYAGMFAPAAG
ncbi:hypothetical protein BH09PLA1_BH09PLA1_30840 [soil metagenome]